MNFFNTLDKIPGSKTYIQLALIAACVICEHYGVYSAPDVVYQLLGVGSGITAKMALDRLLKKVASFPLSNTNKSVK